MTDAVYIAEVIWFSENPVDGRKRLAVCSSLEAALERIQNDKIFGGEDLVATEVEPGALGTEQARAWAVHERSEEPNDEGRLWIVAEPAQAASEED